MAFVPEICTQCGARMEVDDGHDAAICKYCGTAFAVEKAINDYNVNHMDNIQSGRNAINTGYVDQSDQYILMAHRYKYSGNAENAENAEKYYTLALTGWPDNWEANFYSTYYAVMRAERYETLDKAVQMQSSIMVGLLKESVSNEELTVCVREMQGRLSELSEVLFHSYRRFFYKTENM